MEEIQHKKIKPVFTGLVCSERTFFPILDTRDLIPRVMRTEFHWEDVIRCTTIKIADSAIVIVIGTDIGVTGVVRFEQNHGC